MDLRIRAQMDETESMYMYIGQNVYDITEKSLVIGIHSSSSVEAYFEQAEERIKYSYWSMIIFVCTFIPRTLLNVYLMNTGDKWYKDIRPYRVMGSIRLKGDGPKKIRIRIHNSKIYSDWHRYKMPVVEIEPFIDGTYTFVLDEQSFKNAFATCIKDLLAFYVLGGGIFFTSTISCMLSKAFLPMWLSVAVFLAITCGILWRIRLEHKKYIDILSFYRSVPINISYSLSAHKNIDH